MGCNFEETRQTLEFALMSEANQVSLPLGENARKAIERSDTADEKVRQFSPKKSFCRKLEAISRKQGMKGGSVLAHVTDWNDAADEESAPTGEQKQKKAPPCYR